MNKIYSILAALVLTGNVFAQAPDKMSYQAVIRDAGNTLVTSQPVGMQISILQGSILGTAVYVETQVPTTNINGLVSLEIGSGTAVSGTFSTIDWSAGPYFIKTETDPSGGSTYTITGTSQLMSVPYALHAKTADSVSGLDLKNVLTAGNDADDKSIVNVNQIGIGNSSPSYILDATSINGPRFRVFSQDNYYAGLLTKNNTHEYFIGTQGTFESAGGTNSGFHIYDNTVGAQRMVIDASGNVGIGNSSPTAKLDVNGNVKIVDGTEGAGKVLTSDANGNANWEVSNGSLDSAGIAALGFVAGPHTDSTVIANMGFTVSNNTCNLSIGGTYQGGIIFYLDPSGCHGLIAAPTEQSTGVAWAWAVTEYPITYAYGSGLFAGKYNTDLINIHQPNANFAPAIAHSLVLGGYDDWYLPSVEELNKMYQNIGPGNALGLGNIGNFNTTLEYWSSTEFANPIDLGYGHLSNVQAWAQSFGTGVQLPSNKGLSFVYVRAVRAF